MERLFDILTQGVGVHLEDGLFEPRRKYGISGNKTKHKNTISLLG